MVFCRFEPLPFSDCGPSCDACSEWIWRIPDGCAYSSGTPPYPASLFHPLSWSGDYSGTGTAGTEKEMSTEANTSYKVSPILLMQYHASEIFIVRRCVCVWHILYPFSGFVEVSSKHMMCLQLFLYLGSWHCVNHLKV